MTGAGEATPPDMCGRPLKLCVITTLAGPGAVAGGVWEVVVNQARALKAAGHEVTVVAGWLGKSPPEQIRGVGVHLVPVRSPAPGLGLRALVGRGWRDAVRSAADGCDVAHVHLCRDLLTMSATRTLQQLRVPIVVQTHGMMQPSRAVFLRAFDRVMTKQAIHRVSQFISLTDAEQPDLLDLGAPRESITTIHNAVPQPATRWRQPVRPTLLFASRLHPRKQALVFAESVATLRDQGYDVKGRIAGPDQGELRRLKQFLRESQHGQHIKYLGELDRQQLDDEMGRATAFVFPARDEPFGLVLVEALAVGTPVVSTSQTPLSSILDASGAALIADPDAHSMAGRLRELLDHPEAQQSLSRRGHRLYCQQWAEAAMVAKLQTVYECALERRVL